MDRRKSLIPRPRYKSSSLENTRKLSSSSFTKLARPKNFTCCVRVRPDHQSSYPRSVQVVDNGKSLLLLHDKTLLTFDHIFDESSTQEEVYGCCIRNLVDSCFDGINTTVFVYGMSASGKSHTMGIFNNVLHIPQSKQGIIPRVLDDIFQRIGGGKNEQVQGEEKKTCTYEVSISFVEVYQEKVRDLLHSPDKKGSIPHHHHHHVVNIREDVHGRTVLNGAEVRLVNTAQEAHQLLDDGILARTVGKTLMNETSSRSHAVFSITVHQKMLTTGEELKATVYLVDLAGSEKQKRTGAEGQRLKESIWINQGLLTLGKIISGLTESSHHLRRPSPYLHLPYRDSKITRILSQALGGDSRCVMIACISPAKNYLMETLNTLKYAQKALQIKNAPIIHLNVRGDSSSSRDSPPHHTHIQQHQQPPSPLDLSRDSSSQEMDSLTRPLIAAQAGGGKCCNNCQSLQTSHLQETTALRRRLKEMEDDLKHDEHIFALKVKEIQRLQDYTQKVELQMSQLRKKGELEMKKMRETLKQVGTRREAMLLEYQDKMREVEGRRVEEARLYEVKLQRVKRENEDKIQFLLKKLHNYERKTRTMGQITGEILNTCLCA